MMEDVQRGLMRIAEARQRGSSATVPTIPLHPNAMLDMYVGVVRDFADLAKLKVTEEGDREAIRAHYELRRLEIEGQLRQVEQAITRDHEAFDALRKDNREIVLKLLEMGQVDAAITLQTRFLEQFGGSTLDKLLSKK